MTYFLNLGIAIDQLGNALTGGSPDETLSSRAFRTDKAGKRFGKFFRPLIDALFFFQPNHCQEAYMAEVRRKQFPKHFQP